MLNFSFQESFFCVQILWHVMNEQFIIYGVLVFLQCWTGGTFRLSEILGDSSEASTILESALNLQPEVIEALLNARMSQDLVRQISSVFLSLLCLTRLLTDWTFCFRVVPPSIHLSSTL
jgi:hypothetical protein